MTHQRRIRVSLIAAAIITALSVPPAVAAQPCSFDPSTRTVTVNVDPTIPSRWFLDQAGDVSGTIRVVPGNQAPVSCGATANDADSIVITDVTPGGRTDLRIQLFPAWGPGFTDEPGSSDEVEFVVNLGGGRDILDFNALVSPEPQNIRFGGEAVQPQLRRGRRHRR
jgi:hypothetical protein